MITYLIGCLFTLILCYLDDKYPRIVGSYGYGKNLEPTTVAEYIALWTLGTVFILASWVGFAALLLLLYYFNKDVRVADLKYWWKTGSVHGDPSLRP